MAAQEAKTDVPTPAQLWSEREPAPRRSGPKIAPIWLLVGVSVVLLGVLFGQMFATPSAAAAAEDTMTPGPASSTAPSYGSNPDGSPATAEPSPSVRPSATPNSSPYNSGPVDTPTPDPESAWEHQVASMRFPSAAQLYVPAPDPSALPYGTPQQNDSKVVTVYSRDAQSPVVSAIPMPVVHVAPPATIEGDTRQTTEWSSTELREMPSDIETPAPVDIPASTRVRAQLDVPTDSDLLGPVKVHLLDDTCDPRTGALAWPRGSWVTGHLEAVLFKDQRHLAFDWDYITFPNLAKRSLASSVVTEDEEGHSGVAGRRNAHTWSVFRDTLIGSIANAGGNILAALAQKANTSPPVIVAAQGGGSYGQPAAVEMPTIEVGHSIPIELVLTADYTADKPYDEPGWQGCRS